MIYNFYFLNNLIYLYAAKLLQLCLTLCDPMDGRPSGSFVHGILQARILGGLPFPSPGDFPHPWIKPEFPMSTCSGRWVLYHL